MYTYIYIYKKCIHIYISIIYRCTPRWQTSIGHSFQNAMDNHGFFLGGMWRTKHAMLSMDCLEQQGSETMARYVGQMEGGFLGYGMLGG